MMEKGSKLFYRGSKVEVQLGDRVRMKRWFRKDDVGSVCYITGIGPKNRELDGQWAIRCDDGNAIYGMAYAPHIAQPPGNIVFLERGNTQAEVRADERIDETENELDET